MKLILITRDPTERAISQYKMEIGRERYKRDMSFKEIFDNNIEQIRERGEYSKKLKKYYNYFNKEQILILKYEDLEVRNLEIWKVGMSGNLDTCKSGNLEVWKYENVEM